MNIKVDISDIILEGNKVRLRSFRKSDLEDFYAYAKTPGLGESVGWFHHESVKDSKRVLDKFIEDKNILAIEKDGKVIGSISLNKYDEEFFANLKDKRAIQLDFVLAASHQGQKIMTESLELVYNYLFNELKIDAGVGGHFRGNFKSKNLHKKFNYQYFSSHLVKTNMGTMEVTHQYILTKDDYDKYLANKNKEEKLSIENKEDISNENQLVIEKFLKAGESFSHQARFSNNLIFIKLGMVQYDSKIYIGGDLIRIDDKKEINLDIIRDASLIIVETKIR